jgi:hypothetical protein
VIFPPLCKEVGSGLDKASSDQAYFLTQYLIRRGESGHQVLEIKTDPEGQGLMRRVVSAQVLAEGDDVCQYPERVQLYDRTRLIRLAQQSGCRCTIFTGLDEHMTFVLDPDPSSLLTIHVYDIEPPRPSLSACIQELESCGLFGELGIAFEHHIRDINTLNADVYPCRAAGFLCTLDVDPMHGGEVVAGCMTGAQFYTERYGSNFTLIDTCPIHAADQEPFIARCCRKEREGVGMFEGRFGAVVHWGASPRQISASISRLVEEWRAR